MDLVTLAMAKAYSDKKGGYVEPGKVLTFDGNTENKEVLMDTFVKVSDQFYDFSTLSKLVVTVDDTLHEIAKDEIISGEFNTGVTHMDEGWMIHDLGMNQQTSLVISISQDVLAEGITITAGTWVFCDSDLYISRIEFAETIHPIDPKYLPEGGVGYTDPGMVLTFDGNTTGKETFVDADMAFSLVKISNEFYDFSNANKIFLTVRGTGVTEGFTPTVTADPGVTMLDIGGTGSILAISTDGTKEEVSFLSIGTWLFCHDEAYVSRIETAETIHPIEPKYLPGICLPKVLNLAQYDSLRTCMMVLLGSGGGYNIANDSGTFWEDVATDSPLRLEVPLSENTAILVDVTDTTVTNGVPECIGFSLMLNMGAAISKVTVILGKFSDSKIDNGTLVAMAVEPVITLE